MCNFCKHYVLDIQTSKIPAHIEKKALPTSKSVRNIVFNLHFHLITNFDCLMHCCGVSYTVILVQIEQKLRAI